MTATAVSRGAGRRLRLNTAGALEEADSKQVGVDASPQNTGKVGRSEIAALSGTVFSLSNLYDDMLRGPQADAEERDVGYGGRGTG